MQTQGELFADDLDSVDPRRENFLPLRAGTKIIQVPTSFWKDGRRRGDLSAWGLGEIVSRNPGNFERRIIEALSSVFPSFIEAVRTEFARKPAVTPRLSNKRPLANQAVQPARYINPFAEKTWTFAKCPDWLFSRREPTPTEKRVYAKLLFPAPPICQRYDRRVGIIFGLDQSELAKALGVLRQTIIAAIKALRLRGLIEVTGGQGAKQVIRFLWHPWMPETCTLNLHVCADPLVGLPRKAVAQTDARCPENRQVYTGVEKIDLREGLADHEWLEKVVQTNYPNWSLPQLREQWRLHRIKGEKKREWSPRDRRHFLVAWMPRAGEPPTGPQQIPEPEWWGDFISECYPDVAMRSFDEVRKHYGSVVDEGFRWAEANGRQDAKPS